MTKRSMVMNAGILVAGVLLSGCVTASTAPQAAAGGKSKIFVVLDRGNKNEMEAQQWKYRNEVGAYMEADLIRRLSRAGYMAQLIPSEKEYTSAVDSYLVSMKIKSYNPGSSAARIVVGFGAGACSLDMHYAVKQGPKVLQEWDDGIGSSLDWRRLCNALDDKLIRKLNAELLTWK